MLSSVLYLLFSSSVEAHSWIQCTDYRGSKDYYDGSQCHGHVRPMQRGPGDIISPNQVAFGVDQGFNRKLHETPDGQCNSLIDNQFAAGNFPMAKYQRGKTITLAWPAKNHVPETCDNNPGGAGLPDAFNGLYMESYRPGLRITYNREVVFSPMTEGNTHVRHTIDYKGFGNCPKFCENRDKALCTGTFVVPDVPDGRYSFSWRWEFNGGRSPPETYVTCFEAEVQGDYSAPEIGMFVERNRGCNDHNTEDKCLNYADGRNGRVGQQCAWCCDEGCRNGQGNKCEPIEYLEEQGLMRWRTRGGVDHCTPPTGAPTKAPSAKPTTVPSPSPSSEMMAPNPADAMSNCAGAMGQCGGVGARQTCCQSGFNCIVMNEYFSQCQPKAQEKQDGVTMGQLGVMAAAVLIFILALCATTLVVYKKFLVAASPDAYQKHVSMGNADSRSRTRYSGKNDRKKKRRTNETRRNHDVHRTRGNSVRDSGRSPIRTDSGSSWVHG